MMPVQLDGPDSTTALWLRVLARASLVFILVGLLLIVTFFGGVGMQASDNVHGAEFTELLAAARSPAFYRLAMVFDALGWLSAGAVLLAFAGVFAARAPARSAFIAACALGQVTGVLGGFLRQGGVSGLAAQYATSPGQPAAVLESFLDLERIISAFFHAGNLLQGIAFILVAWTALSLAVFPRWLAAWFFIPGVLPLLQFARVAAGLPFSFEIILAHILLGVMLPLAFVAMRYWRYPVRRAAASASISTQPV